MPRRFVYFIYNLLYPFALLLGLPGYLRKGIKRGGLRRNFAQRFGRFPSEIATLPEKPLWFHAVSVGEALVAGKIIRAVHELSPGRPVVLSTTTTTGFRVAEKDLGNLPYVQIIHNPVDLPPIVAWAVWRINPEKVILVESEIWPNLVKRLDDDGIPLLLANARLSPRSEERYLRFKNWVRPVFSKVKRTAVPFPADVERWSALGIAPESIFVSGSVKFDESTSEEPAEKMKELNDWLVECGCVPPAPIWLAGSTHPGEEALCARVWLKLRERHPDLLLVVVPRHAERASEIDRDLREVNVKPVFRRFVPPAIDRSNWETQEGTVSDSTGYDGQVFVSDTTGELRAWYHFAEAVFIGKSLTGRGGQNPVEPILTGCPVVTGPHMENFREVVSDLVANRGLIQARNEDELERAVDELLSDSAKAKEMAEAGRKAIEVHHGSARRTAEWILQDDFSGKEAFIGAEKETEEEAAAR